MNNAAILLFLTLSLLPLAACAHTQQPTPTAEAPMPTTVSYIPTGMSPAKTQAAQRLTHLIEDNLKPFDLPRDFCTNGRRFTQEGQDREQAHDQALPVAFGRVFSDPDVKLFSPQELQAILKQGTQQMTSSSSPQVLGSSGGAALITWSGASCGEGRYDRAEYFYIFDAQGTAWDTGFHDVWEAHPAHTGWIILSGDDSEPREVWLLRQVAGQWEKDKIVDWVGSGMTLSFQDGSRQMQVSYKTSPTTDPPCHFRPEVAFHHALHMNGKLEYDWRNNTYVLVDERYTVSVYVNEAGGDNLQNWQAYCESP